MGPHVLATPVLGDALWLEADRAYARSNSAHHIGESVSSDGVLPALAVRMRCGEAVELTLWDTALQSAANDP